MKKIIIPISTLFVVGLSHAQSLNLSTDENYVYTKTFLHYPKPTDPDQTIKTSETVQYLDGLGRPKQVVNIKASPLGRDVVSHIVYDQYGRQALDYLPVPQGSTGNGAIVTNPLSNATQTDIYGSEKIYAEKLLESSPLDRVMEQKQVGTAWSSKPVKFEYDANADGEVRKYTATFNYSTFTSEIVLSTVGYGANQLYKNTVIDEDLNKTVEFKNGQGQTVLVRKMLDGTTSADTYYVYNDYNQLAYVIPPLAVAANAVDSTTLNNLCYQYKYDSRNRLVEKRLPGKGWEFMLYDKQDRLVATRDANLEAKGQWLYTKYDQFGRVVLTGISTGGTRTVEQSNVETFGSNNTPRISAVSYTSEGMDVYYRGFLTYPDNSKYVKLLSINYYDTYAPYSFNPAFPTTVSDVPVITDNSTGSNISTKSLAVMSFVKNIEDDNWTKNYTWYDTKGRAIGSHSINHLGGYTKTESELDFAGVPQQAITRHKRLDSDVEKVITENFTYDHQNRLLTHKHQVDNNPVEYLTQNEYNELSQLKNKKVGGTSLGSGLQSIDYAYNIRGWMTKINDPANLNGKLFGYEIKYQNPLTNSWTPKYNGNISEIDWKTSQDGVQRRYVYMYDAINRLTGGFYLEPNSSIVWAGYYSEYSQYDLNGNITQLTRMGNADSQTTPSVIDDLTYTYTGNILTSVSDTSQNLSSYPLGGNIISYDDNGNMTSHPDKAISSIIYNYLNLPSILIVGSGKKKSQTEYLYRADGTKLRKNYGGAALASSQSTDYLDGFQYQAIDDLNLCIGCPGPLPVLQFVPTSEGYFDFVKNKYIYNYSDHLGNTRLSYLNGPSGIEVLEENNYYPFGLKHEGYNALAGNPAYNYKYNGKELQETGMYDYGARFYMPDIGRWGVMDNMSEKYSPMSPYNYAINNPINVIDPDGNDIYLLTWFSSDKNGGETGHAGIAIDNYKTVAKKDKNGNAILDKNGKPVTEQIKDGTFTYYDLWPNDPVGKTEMQSNVNADYSKGIKINSLNDLISKDPTTHRSGNVDAEGRSADGIVKIPTTPQQDAIAKSTAKAEINTNKDYNACTNNCSTFSQRVINSAINPDINASQTVTPKGMLARWPLSYKPTSVVAPNNLYNSALKIKGATNIKGPSSVTAKPYLQYFGK
ncbi:DUF6443 domain-containing protein [Chryseobacterium chendengshani]|uniref:DUF6443 domain-containing protein n=1 Tax=Chryseobacterium sp. LJ756 TaxID=2864113 RepID=UPI001C63D089|nr:DUF6443 domain-containing protein [Chryseobacterium sp. LJ756]MBW7676828.1 RHS repeat-associated core domain-containing protein [Chryseobacterium sp. LJ756]